MGSQSVGMVCQGGVQSMCYWSSGRMVCFYVTYIKVKYCQSTNPMVLFFLFHDIGLRLHKNEALITTIVVHWVSVK